MSADTIRALKDEFIASMVWSDASTAHEKSLVLGNLNGFEALLEARFGGLNKDYRELLQKYIAAVVEWEGSDFLHFRPEFITDEEWDELRLLSREARGTWLGKGR